MRFSSLAAAATVLLFAANAYGEDASKEDFISFTSQHCQALLQGQADMSFAMGKAYSRFSGQELAVFNQDFSRKLVAEYGIDASKPCVLDMVTMKQKTDDFALSRAANDRRKLQKADEHIVVVAGGLSSTQSSAPVSIAYRLERVGESPWVITNITFDGHPMADRYREEYEALARKGGAGAVLGDL